MRAVRRRPEHLQVVADITDERERQYALIMAGTIPMPCEDPATPDAYRLGVLVEEVGEVAKEVHEGSAATVDEHRLYDELVQVAAVATAWAEGLRLKWPHGWAG